MSKIVQQDQWVWVVVQDPGGHEEFLGQHDEEKDMAYIPVFLDKKAAQEGLALLMRAEDRKYEVQAIRLDDLSERAATAGFSVHVLNRDGQILEKITKR